MMRIFIFCLFWFFLPNTQASKDAQYNQADFKAKLNRIDYVIALKNAVAKDYWSDFAQQDLFCPIALFSREGTFIYEANAHIQNNFPHHKLKTESKFEVIQLYDNRIDTLNFNFACSYTDADPRALYYQSPVLMVDDLELTQRFIPPVVDLQDWSLMVLHELFHSFQNSFPAYKEVQDQIIQSNGGDPEELLGEYYQKLDWYQSSIRSENQLLIDIWQGKIELNKGMADYQNLRNNRRKRIREEKGIDIEPLEEAMYLLEGNARFFEHQVKDYLSRNRADDQMLSAEDKKLISGMFRNYDILKRTGGYTNRNEKYWLPMGFNLLMILDKNYPAFKTSIYKQEFGLNPYLNQLLEKSPGADK